MNQETDGPQASQTTQIEGEACQKSTESSAQPIVWIGALAVALRMLAVGKPLTGYFATKNCVYAMIARNWALGRASLWYPTLDCIRGGERSLHMLEFPCSAYLVGLAWRCFGGSLDVWGRVLSVGWMLGAVVMLYYYVRRHHGQTAAAGAAFALAVSPVSVIFGQYFMLEPSLVFLTIGTISALDLGLAMDRWRWIILSVLALALLLLTKIYMAVLLLPIGLMILASFRSKAGLGLAGKRRLVVILLLFFIALLPTVAWYAHAYQTGSAGHPLADRVYYSVAQSAESHRLPHPLWTSPDFYIHTFDDFATLVVTPVGFLLFWFGLLHRDGRRHLAWLGVSLLLIWLLPRKFYEMSYYYMVLLPPVCIMIGLGWNWLVRDQLKPGGVRLSRNVVLLTAVLAVVVSMRYVVGPLLVTADEDRPVVAAAEALKRLSSPTDRVIAIHATGIDLLYYCDRAGWTGYMQPDDWAAWIESCRAQGAKYLVVTETTSQPTPAISDLQSVRTPPIAEGKGWQVFQLNY